MGTGSSILYFEEPGFVILKAVVLALFFAACIGFQDVSAAFKLFMVLELTRERFQALKTLSQVEHSFSVGSGWGIRVHHEGSVGWLKF